MVGPITRVYVHMSYQITRISILAAALVAGLPLAATQIAAQSAERAAFTPVSVDSLRALLTARVALGSIPGIVAALITPDGTAQATAGVSGSPDGQPLSPTTRFEIGSITKVVTGTLFADAISRGEVRESDRLVDVLPELRLPPGGEKITLLDLATHRSGVPSFPPAHTPGNARDPWADVDSAVVMRALSGLTALQFEPGSKSEYSNVGAGLLGQALVRRSGTANFNALVQSRFVAPLQLRVFTTDASAEDTRAFAQGHDGDGPVPRWHLDYLAGAGAIVSTLDDMTRMARACLGDAPSELAKAIAEAQSPRRDFVPHRIGLHWVTTRAPSGDVVWHNGGTGGFRSWMGCNRATGRAAVVLTNGSAVGVDDLGMHLVDPSVPLRPPAARATAAKSVVVDPTVMDQLTGSYQLTPAFQIVVSRVGAELFAQATGQPQLALLAESDLRWRVRGVEAAIEFERAPDGRVVALTLVQGGARQRVARAVP